MRYQLPQFIEMEDKIIGPFTLKQFIYLIAVPVICYILHFFVRLPYVILVGIIFFPVALLLAFYKVNGRPFSHAILGLFKYIRRPQIYVWKRVPQAQETTTRGKVRSVKKKKKETTTPKETKDFKKLAKILDKGKNK